MTESGPSSKQIKQNHYQLIVHKLLQLQLDVQKRNDNTLNMLYMVEMVKYVRKIAMEMILKE